MRCYRYKKKNVCDYLQYRDFEDFFKREINVLFHKYQTDRLIELDSKGLNKRMDVIKGFILKGMGIKKASHNRVT